MSKDVPQSIEYGTLRSYLVGFALSLLLTLAAYCLRPFLTGLVFDLSVCALALLQAFVQLILFLHLGKESSPRWNLLIFLFMILIVFILVFGSVWIMTNLNYNLMAP